MPQLQRWFTRRLSPLVLLAALLAGVAAISSFAASPASAKTAVKAKITAKAKAAAKAKAKAKPKPKPKPKPETLAAMQTTLRKDLLATTSKGSALVYDSTTGQTLYSYAPNTARLPASVEKLYTTTTALLKFGATATLQTRVLGVGTLTGDGTYTGTLYLRGGGDPTFGSTTFNNIAYGTGASVTALATALKADGIKQFSGEIVGDGSYFDSLGGGPDTKYQASFETEGLISAIAYDAGFTNVYEDAFQAHPVMAAATALESAMRSAGIKVPTTTTVGFGTTPTNATQLATVPSPTMATLALLTNSPSDDFFAEMLLKGLGAAFGAGGTTADGAAVVSSTISSDLGLTPTLNDGSGLSRADRTTANQVVSLLRQMRSNTAFYDSLAIAGVRGTMVDEMLKSRAANNCRGKTGTLHDVANLVGYCTARNGDKLIFAFLMNGLPYDYTYAHGVEDKMGVALANYDGVTTSTTVAAKR